MLSETVTKINDYARHGNVLLLDRSTIRSFVGMVQTGEATLDDFNDAGGSALEAIIGYAVEAHDEGEAAKKASAALSAVREDPLQGAIGGDERDRPLASEVGGD